MANSKQRLDAFSIRKGPDGSFGLKCGVAWVNRDGSINLKLDLLPINGEVHRRAAKVKSGGKQRLASGVEGVSHVEA